MRIGYTRISPHDQRMDFQKDALNKAGYEKTVVVVACGRKQNQSGLDQLREVNRILTLTPFRANQHT